MYDSATAGELADDDHHPDGRLFREGPVSVALGAGTVHAGRTPGSAINGGLTAMLEQSRDEIVPALVRTVIAHLIFENMHPFYDGTGRAGRYLLALDLSRDLSGRPQ